MSETTEKAEGLLPKYDVARRNDTIGKHDECRYFVLDPQHDPGARFALRAYKVWAARHGYDPLATDLDDWLDSLDSRGGVSDAE